MTAGAIYRHFESKFPEPNSGSLRVWWIPQVPGKPFHWPVADLVQAAMLLDALAAYDDFQFAELVKGEYCNVGGLAIFVDGDWQNWEDEEGNNFDDWREAQKDK